MMANDLGYHQMYNMSSCPQTHTSEKACEGAAKKNSVCFDYDLRL